MSQAFPDQYAAKEFFFERISDRAREEGSPLSRAEAYQLAWTETEPGFEHDPALDQEFEEETDERTFEARVRGLLERAYKQDVQEDGDAEQRYRDAYEALKRHDHYVLVMIDEALGRHLAKRKRWWLPW